ncbi:ribosome small subunit-dependent GTPase A [Streptomyces aureocirculatus]|uniref:ribosome small subunit-dependent GTPase A n=1 Tax=Streptomyces aureocirculatus TaxID=67275 RepID=UPI000691E3F5|nr:ribosome small subunit-dependent GTPase A [Streptomyces aureocirculatus]
MLSGTLIDYGWQPSRDGELMEDLTPGRVVAVHSGAFDVATEDGTIRTRLPRRLLNDGVDVAVGDWVGMSEELVRQVLPRTSAIVRNAAGRATTAQTLASNVDIAFVVTSLGPDLEPRRLERYLVAVWSSGAVPEIVLTKADRFDDVSEMLAEVAEVAVGVPLHVISSHTGFGCEDLRARIGPGTTAVLLGSSGVGKSTLVNRFAGREVMAAAPTRAGGDEGRHTTTHRELLLLPGGGLLIDTPGLRELQLWDDEGLDDAFADIAELAEDCRFRDCTHTSEPRCAVLGAVDDGTLTPERLRSWRKLQRELLMVRARQDVRLQHEENRRWEEHRREARAKARRR